MLVNFIFTLFKQSVKIDLLKYKNHVIKTCCQIGFKFIKKNFICKEKSGTLTKVKLVTKIKKHNQLYFGTLVLALYRYCGDNS